jgi:hypothetical protein
VKVDGHWLWSAATETPLIHYTHTDVALYAFCLAWPGRELVLNQPVPGPRTEVRVLGYQQPLRWQAGAAGIAIEVPPLSVAELPCRHVWVFKLTGIENGR